jgi:hypothetical protein
MIELKDGINFHTFEASFRPEGYNRRREGESVTEWLERVSIKDSIWLEKAKWRKSNSYWIESSSKIAVAVLSFLRENKMKKETLEDLIGFELVLNEQHDWKLSEIKKLELYLNKKLL